MNDPKDHKSGCSDAPKDRSLVRLPNNAIAITRLFCPNGHSLIDAQQGARFYGFGGIVLHLNGKQSGGEVILSPIHGDDTKLGETDFEPGEILRITCPLCKSSFPVIEPCACNEGAMLVGLFLDENRSPGNQVVVCTAWGCLRSRIIDRFQVISRFE